MPIQVLKPKFHVDECLEQVKECLEKGWTGMGFKTVEFEEEWKKYTGHKYAYYLNSNTVGLHLAVKILKMKYTQDNRIKYLVKFKNQSYLHTKWLREEELLEKEDPENVSKD